MQTIRLLINGAQEEKCRDIARRLRHCTVTSCGQASPLDFPEDSFDAVAFVNSATVDYEEVQQLLLFGTNILLASDGKMPRDAFLDLVGAASLAKVQLCLVNPNRFLSSRRLLKQQIELGKLGDLGLIRLHHWESAPAKVVESRSLPAPLVLDIETVIWLFGAMPNLIFATEQESRAGDSSAGLWQIHLGFPSGGMAIIAYTNSLPAGDDYQALTLIGSAGAAYADDHQNMQILYRGGHPVAVRAEERALQQSTMLQEFVDALCADRDLLKEVLRWQYVWSSIDAVQSSLASRQATRLEDL